MVGQVVYASRCDGITDDALHSALSTSFKDELEKAKRVLLLVPDYTRYHSNAGKIANMLYHIFTPGCQVDLLEALGTHVPMTDEQILDMYGDIPRERFIEHNWRTKIQKIGTVPREFVFSVSEGVYDRDIDVEVSRHLYDGYDLILSIGQVVPHEVVGMANQAKNIFVGCGGSSMINASHIVGAFYGMERMMGRDFTPVRKIFDYAAEHFLQDLPLAYIMTVTTVSNEKIATEGLFIGRERSYFEKAVALSLEKNMKFVDEPLKKVVVYLNPAEFKSTWLGNKSIYRTRMAIADGGELIILAPGVETFGEDRDNDVLIRKYGYCGRENVIALTKTQDDLKANLSAAAHLIHGSSDGRFSITYCTSKLTGSEVAGVHFGYIPYEEASMRYDPTRLRDGFNTLPDGETIFFISNPALGLWADRSKYI